MFDSGILKKIAAAGALLVFLFFAWLGYRSGKQQAQSRLTIANAQALKQGFEYFYSDQDRFPSPAEFTDSNLMGIYYSVFPPKALAVKNCPQTFRYQNSGPRNYILAFCLPQASGGYVLGWNQLKP